MNRKLAIGAWACLSLMLLGAAHAQNMTATATSPAGAGPSQSCGEATGPTACGAGGPASKSDKSVDEGGGNPINVITGNKYQREVDLPALPGVLGLELVRHYNPVQRHRLSPSSPDLYNDTVATKNRRVNLCDAKRNRLKASDYPLLIHPQSFESCK